MTTALAGCASETDGAPRPTAQARHASPSATPTAGRLTLEDGSGDVWRVHKARRGRAKHAAGQPSSDVTSATIEYGARSVTVQLRFVDLQPVGVGQTQGVYVQTPRRLYLATVRSGADDRAGRARLEDWSSSHGRAVRCADLSHRIDYRTDTVTVAVPRTCLGDPDWVRLELYNTTNSAAGRRAPVYVDNPHNHQPAPLRFTRRLRPPR